MITITQALLEQIAPPPHSLPHVTAPVAEAINQYFIEAYVDTPIRMAHFLAQAAHESDGFRTLEEYASGRAYEGRSDLGNNCIGDGVRFKGRGIFQLTGRDNYTKMGTRLGLDLLDNPMLAAHPDVSVRIAFLYWKDKGLNSYADADDILRITKRINGGLNGLASRQEYLRRAKLALGVP